MSMTQRELIDYCNGRDGKCSDVCLHNSRECDAFVGKYRCVPYLSNITQPELYSDDVIDVQDGEEYKMSMTLEEAIKHAEEVSNKCQNFVTAHKEDRELGFIQRTEKCAEEHRQLAEWLRELAERRKAPEIIRCKDCENWDTSWQNVSAPNYHYCPLMDGTYSGDFYCGKAERRADAIN